MTDDRELSLILDHWLSDGPTEMPERVVDVVATSISRQRQRPAWRLDGRRYAMNTNFKLAAALVAVLAVVIVGYNLLPVGPTGVGGPTPTATPASQPTPTPAASPTPLVSLNANGPCGQQGSTCRGQRRRAPIRRGHWIQHSLSPFRVDGSTSSTRGGDTGCAWTPRR